MKIATWNVNGIRARQAQVQEWIARERPDVVCLQEIKAAPTRCRPPSARWRATGATGTAAKAIRASASTSARPSRPIGPRFLHPEFDFENRIATVEISGVTVASVYVPNGGKDFPAKMRFLEALDAYAAAFRGRPPARAVRRHERRAHRHGRPPEGAQAARDRTASRGARAHRADSEPRPRGRRARARPGQRRPVHLVGAVAQHAAAQHRLAARLRLRERRPRRARRWRARCRATSARATTRRSWRPFS